MKNKGMKTQTAVAMRVSQLLIENDMTQYALSIKSGLSKQAIANIINEKYTTVKFDTIIKLADGFGMDWREFTNDKLFDRINLNID